VLIPGWSSPQLSKTIIDSRIAKLSRTRINKLISKSVAIESKSFTFPSAQFFLSCFAYQKATILRCKKEREEEIKESTSFLGTVVSLSYPSSWR